MSKSKSKSKKNTNNGSNAKNIKALINQNKMIERENAEAEKRKLEEAEAREQAKKAKLESEEAKAVVADEVIEPGSEVESATTENSSKKGKKTESEASASAENDGKKDAKQEKAEKDKKDGKDSKGKKDKKKKDKGEKRGLGKRIKETVSELKKISWPSFGTVVKKTGIVLAVVIFFAIVLFAFDLLLSVLYELLLGQPVTIV